MGEMYIVLLYQAWTNMKWFKFLYKKKPKIYMLAGRRIRQGEGVNIKWLMDKMKKYSGMD